jgi:hypothetical protein
MSLSSIKTFVSHAVEEPVKYSDTYGVVFNASSYFVATIINSQLPVGVFFSFIFMRLLYGTNYFTVLEVSSIAPALRAMSERYKKSMGAEACLPQASAVAHGMVSIGNGLFTTC